MPLPSDPKTPWPPASVAPMIDTYQRWGAWYSGNVDKLCQAYGGMLSTIDDPKGYDSDPSRRSIFSRSRERMFWGNIAGPGNNALRSARLHIPLASDVAATSADLIFGAMPTLYCVDDATPAQGSLTAPSDQPQAKGDASPSPGDAKRLYRANSHRSTQDYLDECVEEEGVQARLLEAAEIAAAHGGVFLRVGWDKQVADHPLLDSITPDKAVPEWRSNRLAAVTFWRILPNVFDGMVGEGGKVWRHLERHERGVILHGLYRGTRDRLGDKIDLKGHPDTAMFLDSNETGASRLAVEYLPNIAPDRDMPGRPEGRSDYAGIDGPMDALDEVWTSWMRDIRLAKGRLIVPDSYLENRGRGQGAVFDPEQEVFQTVDALPATEGMSIQLVQFDIRVEQHQATAMALTAAALRGAGYSVQTFGEGGDGIAATATEVDSRESRSDKTRARKIGYAQPVTRRVMSTLLEIAIRQFGPDGVKAIRPRIEFPDAVAASPAEIGQVVQLLFAAEAASVFTRVKMVNPDWSEDQINEEVDRMREDVKAAMPDVAPPGGATAGGGAPPGGSKSPPKG